MFSHALIIPTGNEIAEGIVLDTDSPLIMQHLLRLNPLCQVSRCAPLRDDESLIIQAVLDAAQSDCGLIVIIGGSGGGHRFSATLGKDFTHSALTALLEPKYSSEIYGKNGHLWCKLVCGIKNRTLIINVPGPYREAEAAIQAFAEAYRQDAADLQFINRAMIEAIAKQYPAGNTQ